jgi:hypothetical protein
MPTTRRAKPAELDFALSFAESIGLSQGEWHRPLLFGHGPQDMARAVSPLITGPKPARLSGANSLSGRPRGIVASVPNRARPCLAARISGLTTRRTSARVNGPHQPLSRGPHQ